MAASAVTNRSGKRVAQVLQLPPGRTTRVRTADGVGLHVEEFGPKDGYPIVLTHGITCAVRVWHEQINDLSRDYRVIAFDHRGHGKSDVPRHPSSYSLDHLAADLDAVLAECLRPNERAVIAGHSMGGMAIASWAERHPDSVRERADAVALINTTIGDLIEEIQLLRVPQIFAMVRVILARQLIRTFGSAPVFWGAQPGSRWFVQMMGVGFDADPAIADFVHDLFATTPRLGRGAWARVLVDSIGSRHIDISGLHVPTVVIGSTKDRLLPMSQARKIAAALPNLVELVEVPGGHCAILEHPELVNEQLRLLAEGGLAEQRIS
jgi:pimeloyl-ACP methyl ester carboxylesterase